MALTLQQLEQIDLQAGWPASLVPMAAALEMVESGGNPAAVNPSSGAAGLFQIYPAQPGSLDPLTNARQALAKYQSQGWGAWLPYEPAGAYQRFLGAAQAAFGDLGQLAGGAVAAVGSAAAPPVTIGQGISGAVTSTGHGLADALGVGVGDVGTFVRNQAPALAVALVVALVLWSR